MQEKLQDGFVMKDCLLAARFRLRFTLPGDIFTNIDKIGGQSKEMSSPAEAMFAALCTALMSRNLWRRGL